MKKILLIVVAFLCYSFSFSQSFNYQAVVRDGSNNPIVNQAIGVQISLNRAGATIYQETHTVTSNDNGVITLPVGTGSATIGAFSSINWSTQDFVMDTAVDVTGGTSYTSLGTTVLRQVPYAMYAASSPNSNFFFKDNTVVTNVDTNAPAGTLSDDFVFGSFQLDSNGSNSVFNARMFYDKSKRAFRAGFTFGDAWDEDNIGDYSVGFGEGGIASGRNSFSMGRNANATGNESFAFGLNAGGFADYAKGFGLNARAFGQHATAIGRQLIANSMAEIQLGQYSNFVSGSPDTWVPTDRLFVIGNGQEDINLALNSDALVMLKNGNTTLNGTFTIDGDNQGPGTSFTLPGQDGTANQIMQTDGSGNVTWVTPAASAIPNGGNNGEVLTTDGAGNLSWTNNDILPSGGTSGFVLSTDGSGNYTWVTVEDTDADPTNEIELPTGGTNGQVLATDGSGVYTWVNQTSTPVFVTENNVTNNGNEVYGTNDFVFGAPTNETAFDVAAANRIFFDKSKAAIRVGRDIGGQDAFGDVNIGAYSAAFGINPKAAGENSFAAGFIPNASGRNAVAMGNTVNATGTSSIAIGEQNTASGAYSVALGVLSTSETYGQTTLGYLNTPITGNAGTPVLTDRLFVIGNGTFDAMTGSPINSDALVILKNGNTTINGEVTIDGDNQGSGTSYTLPAQDGTANQVMRTDGSGNVSWADAASGGTNLPAGGTNGQILSTDGSGGYSWVTDAVDDADSDATNEIELPVGGTNGQVLSTDGSGVYSWVDQTAMSNVTFSTTSNVTSNANGDTTTDDFVFGSTQLDGDGVNFSDDETRMFFSKSKSAFRVGRANSNEWDNVNVGTNSMGLGNSNIVKGTNSTAIGDRNIVNEGAATALGSFNVIDGFGASTIGTNLTSEGLYQISLGRYNTPMAATSTDVSNIPLTDRLLVVGNGDFNQTSDALVILNNGDTTLNGQLTIDGDNTGSGNSYTLPAQDGTSNQVMTTDGSGNVSWAASNGLPSAGTNGQVLTTDGTNANWTTLIDNVDDADNDPTNEIELPTQSGQSGKILTTDGTSPSWVDAPTELPAGGTTGQVLKSDGAGGSTWSSDIEATSIKIASLPAFNVTSNGTSYTSVGEKEVGDWNSTGNTDLFNDGNHLNITNGRFTAPVDGLYFFSTQVRIDGLNGASGANYSRVMIVKNGDKKLFRNGLHSIRNADAGTANYDTQHVSGILKLEAGDYVSVFVETTGDANFTVQVESGFNGYLVNKM